MKRIAVARVLLGAYVLIALSDVLADHLDVLGIALP